MQFNDFNYLMDDLDRRRTRLKGYDWQVVVDPTRSAAENGLFYGRLFRSIDIHLDRDERSSWPDGIVFRNITSGRRLTFHHGRLIDPDTQRVFVRAARVRSGGFSGRLRRVSREAGA